VMIGVRLVVRITAELMFGEPCRPPGLGLAVGGPSVSGLGHVGHLPSENGWITVVPWRTGLRCCRGRTCITTLSFSRAMQ